jgi:hypothetical protein
MGCRQGQQGLGLGLDGRGVAEVVMQAGRIILSEHETIGMAQRLSLG